ncbi:protein TolR [Halodesulfovibrio spirochaetisodalis]|uniref:Biopolymer transporter ExbD n=1 Tax=Halodesulfovibrio spirochaetisodalis TaxID=1560234 RepID=A0A1B7XHB7_9BACT|nr:protein TolR [Halodesulfovibrio spirochaetisodalis]OBQ54885.1 biopolymer transporter ExbD [Halodesulfovibrio spirochaetisodalis]
MAISLGNKKGFVSEINVTPFVDVMLVLLIIFMVTAPLMTQGLDVELPQTQTVSALPSDKDHLILTIDKNGVMMLDDYKVTEKELPGHLERLVKKQNKQLFLRADKNVAYGNVVKAMGIIKGAGITNLGVLAETPETATAKK